MSQRQSLRRQLCQRRKNTSLLEQGRAARAITAQLIQNKRVQKSQHLAGYWAMDGEIDLHLLFKWAWVQNKKCYLPIVLEDRLIFSQVDLESPLVINQWGIPEPAVVSHQTIEAVNLDLVLTPLVAFDSKGHRLGRGAGYYDRSFAFLITSPRPVQPYLIGVAYEWQEVPQLEVAAWDVPLNSIVTDTHWINIK